MTVESPTAPPPPAPAAMSDADWLATECGTVRESIQDPSSFDRDALLWRRACKDIALFRLQTAKHIPASRPKSRPGPLTRVMLNVTYVEHPAAWDVCPACNGQNLDRPDCDGCHGDGYLLAQREPARKK